MDAVALYCTNGTNNSWSVTRREE